MSIARQGSPCRTLLNDYLLARMKFTVRVGLNLGLILFEIFPQCLEHHDRLVFMPRIFLAPNFLVWLRSTLRSRSPTSLYIIAQRWEDIRQDLD